MVVLMPKRLTELSDGSHLYKYIRARVTGPNRKSGSRVCYRHFDSVSDKYVELMSECCNGELRGGPTFELFRLGGNKKIIWVDIDTNDWDAFRLWEGSSSFPFPTDSYRAVEASGLGSNDLWLVPKSSQAKQLVNDAVDLLVKYQFYWSVSAYEQAFMNNQQPDYYPSSGDVYEAWRARNGGKKADELAGKIGARVLGIP